jgi:hypothetical protein
VAEAPDARLFPYADHVLDRLERESEAAPALRDAAVTQAAWLLDFHPQAGTTGWCAAIRIEGHEGALVHLRGLAKRREDCAALGRVLAALIARRYRLAVRPRVAVEGVEIFD